jgi:hypothetical protein
MFFLFSNVWYCLDAIGFEAKGNVMAVANSYVLGLPDRDAASIDTKSAGPLVLKALADQPHSLMELVSLTGLDEAKLKDVLTNLTSQGLVGTDERGYAIITNLGYRAQMFVSS